ncbi:MAG: hypothetical protein A3F73_02180 [Gallionellales bacterium RIFCSPLOWO2_12_FULL_59_22]|nr:MAG: hypothetical protein A3H99_04580 [Gallionellales bacterium RIFCSPLOWO2_02_FULL_59_110]OGT01965.1 MAG: hypothetical protein A2Z65_04390 [Gallionellales bacterium RIFCSPLOWO2_02_58_13]OGT10913.1 MAG: hypothetical protein A3F73_02180 [Gallionellales bacterium RIFCSPLOWO2_12_FULL_59_22]
MMTMNLQIISIIARRNQGRTLRFPLKFMFHGKPSKHVDGSYLGSELFGFSIAFFCLVVPSNISNSQPVTKCNRLKHPDLPSMSKEP